MLPFRLSVPPSTELAMMLYRNIPISLLIPAFDLLTSEIKKEIWTDWEHVSFSYFWSDMMKIALPLLLHLARGEYNVLQIMRSYDCQLTRCNSLGIKERRRADKDLICQEHGKRDEYL